jgi:hypothetical protein
VGMLFPGASGVEISCSQGRPSGRLGSGSANIYTVDLGCHVKFMFYLAVKFHSIVPPSMTDPYACALQGHVSTSDVPEDAHKTYTIYFVPN